MRLIDADALFEALGLDQYNNGEGMTAEEEWIAAAIMDAPTIEAEPVRRGRWVAKGYPWNACSCCGTYVNGYDCWSYCPYCGAKMEGER